jgi:hypothetical protein
MRFLDQDLEQGDEARLGEQAPAELDDGQEAGFVAQRFTASRTRPSARLASSSGLS